MFRIEERTPTASVPWYVWCSVLAVTSAMVGVHWDISWHRTIGRDTFWSPPHIAIYMCGVLAGISCGYLILSTTFDRQSPLRDVSVRIWGFHAPLGAFIAAWGGVAMLTSAPFDDWWHNAYGLDVKILSPPHMVLASGVLAVSLGSLLLVLGRMNRAEGRMRGIYEWIYIYLAGMAVVNLMTVAMESSGRSLMHSAMYYRNQLFALTFVYIATAKAAQRKWAATEIALVYMGFWCAMNWILPLFPGEPKLGPVYYPVTHFVPSSFPMLLVAPAIVLDLLRRRIDHWQAWRQATAIGTALLVTVFAVQWNFGTFLQSPWARNWFFHANNFDYRTRPESHFFRYLFYEIEKTPAEFWSRMALTLLMCIFLAWVGIHTGRWMRRVQR
jgi:hypothetical protein